MRKTKLTSILMILIVISACSESSVVGEGFIESTDYELSLINSIPLEFTTIRFDSLITSQEDRLLIGGRRDTEYGDIEMESFFLLDLISNSTIQDGEDLEYDSISITLPMDGFTLYLDDQTIRETVIVEKLAGELEYLDDEDALYNYSDIEGVTNSPGVVLSEREFLWSTDRVRNLNVRLPDDLGIDLFSRWKNEDEIFVDQDEANEFLKGFKISLKNPTFAAGLSKDSLKLTIHTTDISTSSLSNVDLDFFIGRATPYYSKFKHSNIPENLIVNELDDEIPSDSLNDNSFIIGGLGYATKIEITEVRNLLLDGDEFILAGAELKLRWFEHEQEVYPNTLNALVVDEDFVDITGGQSFTLRREFDDEYGRDNYYILDATQIVDFILAQRIGSKYYLVLTLPDYNSSPSFVMLGDGSYSSEMNIYTIKN